MSDFGRGFINALPHVVAVNAAVLLVAGTYFQSGPQLMGGVSSALAAAWMYRVRSGQ